MNLPRLTPETATIYAAIIAVVGSIAGSMIGGWIAAKATRRATREAAAAAERVHTATQEAERRAALKGVRREFAANARIAEKPYAGEAWVPLGQVALRSAYAHLATLPDDTYAAIQEAQHAGDRYNALVAYLNHEGYIQEVPADAYDFAAHNVNAGIYARRDDSNRAATELIEQALPSIQRAIEALNAFLDPMPTATSSTRATRQTWWRRR